MLKSRHAAALNIISSTNELLIAMLIPDQSDIVQKMTLVSKFQKIGPGLQVISAKNVLLI